jgi:hypothetical protein
MFQHETGTKITVQMDTLNTIIVFDLTSSQRNYDKYSVSHSKVAPENVGLQKEQKYNTFACHTCIEMRLFFGEFAKRKLSARKYKIR